MKPVLKIGLTAVLCMAAMPVFGQQPEWKEFVWKEGKAAILLPGTPKEMKNNLQVELSATTVYLVNFTDIPQAKETTEENLNFVYNASRDAVVKQLKGKLLSEKKVMLEKHLGREFQVEVPNLGVYRTRLFQVGTRLYQVILIAPAAVAQGKESDRYFESFKLVK